MLKFLLILVLLIYLIYKVGGFFFKLLFMGSQQQRSYDSQHTHQQKSHTPPNSNVKVDYVPKKDRKSGENFEGGQYVDFEEVK